MKEVKLRTRFISILMLVMFLVLLLVAIISPQTTLYTAGVTIPLFFGGTALFFCDTQEFIGLVNISVARMIYLVLLAVGLFIYFTFGLSYSLSWFLAAVVVLFYEPTIRSIVGLFGGF